MAGYNSPFSSGGSISSLLKSSQSAANTIANYNDAVKAYEWDLSAKTDEDYSAYKNYLQSKAKGTTDPNKILDYSKKVTTITRQNISTSILRENIQMMSGSASLNDKYSLVSSQFVRAYQNGDFNLAQSLESQAYSISQSIQQQAQQAAEAGARLAKAGAGTTATGYEGVATGLNNSLKQFNRDYASAGQKGQQSAINAFINSPTVKKQMAALGVSLPNGAKPNYFDIVEGVAHAVYQAHTLASQAIEPYDPDKAQTYADKANGVVTGDTTFKVLGGSYNLHDLQTAATALANGKLAYNATTGGFGKAEIPGVPKGGTATGFNFVPGQGAQVQVSPNAFKETLPSGTVNDLKTLGIQTNPGDKNITQGSQVQVTANSPDWLKKVAGNGTLLNVFTKHNAATNQNNLVFKGDAQKGPGSSVYYVVKDQTGKQGVYEEGQYGSRLVSADNGFDQWGANQSIDNKNNNPHQGLFGRALSGIENSASNLFGSGLGLFGGHASAHELINNSTTLANQEAAKALLAHPAPPLPNISLAPPPALPKININPLPSPKKIAINPFPSAINPRTANPQAGNLGVQGTGGVSLQNAGFRLQ